MKYSLQPSGKLQPHKANGQFAKNEVLDVFVCPLCRHMTNHSEIVRDDNGFTKKVKNTHCQHCKQSFKFAIRHAEELADAERHLDAMIALEVKTRAWDVYWAYRKVHGSNDELYMAFVRANIDADVKWSRWLRRDLPAGVAWDAWKKHEQSEKLRKGY